MSPILSLLLASALPLASSGPAEPQSPPRGGVVAVVRVLAEVLRAERALPQGEPGGLERQVSRRADGQMQVEFD